MVAYLPMKGKVTCYARFATLPWARSIPSRWSRSSPRRHSGARKAGAWNPSCSNQCGELDFRDRAKWPQMTMCQAPPWLHYAPVLPDGANWILKIENINANNAPPTVHGVVFEFLFCRVAKCSDRTGRATPFGPTVVMAGLDPAIHVFARP